MVTGIITLYFIYGLHSGLNMEDSEPDTFVLKTMPETFVDMLKDIGVESEANELGTQDLESGDYYSRVYTRTARMVTNRGTLTVHGTNIDMVQIIQKG